MSDGNEFEKVTALIGLIADPKAAPARLAELRQAATDNDKAAAKIEADRVAHEIKVAADKAEIAEERRRAASVWQTAQEAER
jgi:uncharacterized protein YicC (UPF0701 family)